MEPGAGIAFEFTKDQGAVLITKNSTYREDAERELIFKDYIIKHYESWVAFSRAQRHGDDIQPILVTGVDLTREFATAAYSNNRARMECRFSAAAPTIASASVSMWGSWSTEGLIHTNCGPHFVHAIQGVRESSEGPSLESEIPPDDYNQCVFVRYFTIRKLFMIPVVIKAGAGPHRLPKSDPRGDNTGEEGLRASSDDDDSAEVGYSETVSTSDEVIHNVPSVCPERYPRLPLLTNWIKGGRDGFDIVAEFIFQVRNVLLCISCTKERTHFDREPRRNLWCCTTTTFKIFSRYACALNLIPHSLWSRRTKKKRYWCSLSLGWPNGSRLTKTEVNRSRFSYS